MDYIFNKMKQYLDLLQDVLKNGTKVPNRTGTDTLKVFGRQMRFDLREGFPLLTTKKVHFKSIAYELLWFIKGYTNTRYLINNGVTIWNEWADENGNLGPIYGAQWRNWLKDRNALTRPVDIDEFRTDYIDQLQETILNIKRNPYSRRHIVTAWNPSHLPDESLSPQENVDIGRMALAPCHMMFQFNVEHHYIDLIMYQRSVDVFLGLPFNIASYALLLAMVAQVTNLQPREFIWMGGDTHLYYNHIDQAHIQLERNPKELAQLVLNSEIKNIDDFKYEDISLNNYNPDSHIKAEISI